MRIILLMFIIPMFLFGQTSITPNVGSQGQNLDVVISGNYEDFFEDFSGTNFQYRLISNDSSPTIINLFLDHPINCCASTSFNIPDDADLGMYDLEKRSYWEWFTAINNAFL